MFRGSFAFVVTLCHVVQVRIPGQAFIFHAFIHNAMLSVSFSPTQFVTQTTAVIISDMNYAARRIVNSSFTLFLKLGVPAAGCPDWCERREMDDMETSLNTLSSRGVKRDTTSMTDLDQGQPVSEKVPRRDTGVENGTPTDVPSFDCSHGSFIATACQDCTVKLWDANTNALVNTLRHKGDVYRVFIDPSNTKLASCYWNSSKHGYAIAVWDLMSGVELLELSSVAFKNCVAFDSMGQQLVVCEKTQNEIVIFNVDSSASSSVRRYKSFKPMLNGNRVGITCLAYFAECNRLFCASASNVVAYDIEPREPMVMYHYSCHTGVSTVRSPQGKYCAVLTAFELNIISNDSLSLLRVLDGLQTYTDVCFGESDDFVYVSFPSGGLGEIKMWQIADSQATLIRSITAPCAAAVIAFNYVNNTLVALLRDEKCIRWYHESDGKEAGSLPYGEDGVSWLCCSPLPGIILM
jgi:hypothetical protein